MTLTTIKKDGLDEIALDHVFTIGALGNYSAYTFQGEGLNGTVNNPTLYLTRGKTYRFENGSGGHPLRIQSTSGQSGTAYNTGVTGNNTTGTVIVEVQHDAPDVLYYQCTSHAAMNGILYITGALADGGVTTAKIADDGVTQAKIGSGAVGSSELASDAVTTAKLADDAVTTDKLANSINTEIAANTAKTTNATHTGEVTGATGLIIADNVVDEANLKVSNSPSDGYFLQAQSGNTGGLTWAQVAQPDLTNLSASNLTSGTVPDARFPATLPAASGANLTNLAAANLTGALPAISGANLTNLPGGGKVTRIFSVESSGTSNYYYYSQGNPWITTGPITNVSTNSRFLIFARFELRLQNSHGSIKAYCNFGASGGTTYGGQSNNTGSNSWSTTQFTAYDAASNTNNRSYYFNSYSTGSISVYGADVRNGFIVVLELDVS